MQPFDIVKVRVQTAAPGTFSSPLDCATKLLKNEGPLGFYKVSCVEAEPPSCEAARLCAVSSFSAACCASVDAC